ncbi:MAG TPA: lysylphosphatidylglycerol synthase domain-containing protein [Thermoanaerobaculia bacterium]|nr:lysylphosphatidylglycerol synthase domain-containing protein [Thermoanaerobaculia bacterium]
MKALSRVFLAAGTALFVWLVFRIGPGALAADLRRVGARLLLLVALGTVTFAFDTLGWRFGLSREDRGRVPFRSLFAMRIAGDAVNYVTPSAAVGGELVRIALLRRFVAATPAIASVVLLVVTQFFSQVIFVAAGIVYCLPRLLAGRWAAAAAIPLGFLAALAAGLVFLAVRSDGFRRIDRLTRRFAFLRRFTDAEGAEALDREIFGAFRSRPLDLAGAVLCFLGAWSVGIVEAWLILSFLGTPVSWGTAFSIESLSVLVETAFFFVPAKAGTQEGGKVAIFAALGLRPSQGFALGLVRRLRELAWALAGLVTFAELERRRAAERPTKTDPV